MRECGECTRCCYTMNVPEYNSPANSYCSKCNVGVGCTIHSERKAICKNFSCLWLSQPQIPENLRPDKCHIMFELPVGSKTYIGHLDPEYPDAINNPEVLVLIRKITEAGHPVLIYQGKGKDKLYALPLGMTKEDVQNDVRQTIKVHMEAGRI